MIRSNGFMPAKILNMPSGWKSPQLEKDNIVTMPKTKLPEPIMTAALVLVIPLTSFARAVMVSSMEISDVNAANINIRKNAAPMIEPPGICANAVDRVTNRSPAPSFGSRP